MEKKENSAILLKRIRDVTDNSMNDVIARAIDDNGDGIVGRQSKMKAGLDELRRMTTEQNRQRLAMAGANGEYVIGDNVKTTNGVDTTRNYSYIRGKMEKLQSKLTIQHYLRIPPRRNMSPR